jgi:hypothetical protein
MFNGILYESITSRSAFVSSSSFSFFSESSCILLDSAAEVSTLDDFRVVGSDKAGTAEEEL